MALVQVSRAVSLPFIGAIYEFYVLKVVSKRQKQPKSCVKTWISCGAKPESPDGDADKEAMSLYIDGTVREV